jgi:hypothetical protein
MTELSNRPGRAAADYRSPAMAGRRVFGLLRLGAGAAVLTAVVAQIADQVAAGAFAPAEYFSYFTVQSSLVNVVVLLVGAWLALRRRSDPELFTAVRMSTVAYAAVTCVVYNVLLRDLPGDGYDGLAWPGELMHVWVPVFIAVEWVLAPGRAVLGWGRIGTAVCFPLAWLAFTLVRGVLTGWYPYPFLNPDGPDGPVSVIVYVVAISAFIIAVSSLSIAVSRAGAARSAP